MEIIGNLSYCSSTLFVDQICTNDETGMICQYSAYYKQVFDMWSFDDWTCMYVLVFYIICINTCMGQEFINYRNRNRSMRPETQKKDMETQPKILNLGRPNRIPLSSVPPVNSVPVCQITKISPSPINPNLPPIATTIFPKLNHPQVHPFRIISQHIGIPFQIRIPTSQINYLEKQVKELRLKCQLLEAQHHQKNNQSCQGRHTKDKEIESTFQEISKSTKNIEDHLGSVLSGQCEFGKGSQEAEISQIGQKQVQEIIRELECKSEKIQKLEARNKCLEQAVEEAQAQLQKLNEENEALRKQIIGSETA